MMTAVHKYLKVDPRLTKYVRSVVVLEEGDAGRGSELPLFTRGMPVLHCRCKGNVHTLTLFGQSAPDESWPVAEGEAIISFFFYPFVAGPLFKLSADVLKAPVTLNRWDEKKSLSLNKRLSAATSSDDKVRVLGDFIYGQSESNRRDCELILYATDKFLLDTKADIIARLHEELHVTERTFQRIFRKYVGVPPNEYRRICQYYSAFSQLKDGSFVTLTDVAYANGFFDQSHYIKSFRQFTDLTPNEYLKSGLKKKKE